MLFSDNSPTAIYETFRKLASTCDQTADHSYRVCLLMKQVTRRLLLPVIEAEKYELAALLHDIGKIHVPFQILRKPTSLSPIERMQMQEHSELGAKIASDMSCDLEIQLGLLHHHEWYNGEGYPFGLKGSEIPKIARMIAVLDAYDAITSDRPYRSKRSSEEACMELSKGKNTQFDPSAVEIFLNCLGQPAMSHLHTHGMV